MCSITFTVLLFVLFSIVYILAHSDDTDVFNKAAIIPSIVISAILVYLVIGALNDLNCFNPLKDLVT